MGKNRGDDSSREKLKEYNQEINVKPGEYAVFEMCANDIRALHIMRITGIANAPYCVYGDPYVEVRSVNGKPLKSHVQSGTEIKFHYNHGELKKHGSRERIKKYLEGYAGKNKDMNLAFLLRQFTEFF